MASNDDRIRDKVGFWDKLRVSLIPYPGGAHEREAALLDIARRNEEEEKRKAEAEAIRRRRMQMAGTGGG